MSVDGTWNLVLETPQGRREPKVTFKTEGAKLSGTWTGQMGSTDFQGTADGDSLSFQVEIQALGRTISMQGRAQVAGDSLKGEITGPGGRSIPVTGRRAS